MWTKPIKNLPKADQIYQVYGILNPGTTHETKGQFDAYYNTESKKWENHDWDDVNLCEHEVKFWFDFDQVKKPM